MSEQVVVETWEFTGQKVKDNSKYTGTLGTAFLLLKSYHVTNKKVTFIFVLGSLKLVILLPLILGNF
ncbi:putative six-hairpin glycosidase-like superfamily [Helianthus anomalus]